jgi:hypothetical protein
MYKVRKVRNQPHFGIYKNGKLHSTYPTKRLAKKMLGGALGDEPEPRYIEPIIKSPRSIPSHAVSTVEGAEEEPIESIMEEVNEPTFAHSTPEDVDYPTIKDVLETANHMIRHYGINDHSVPLDIHHIQTSDITAGPNLTEYIPTTKRDIQRHKDRLTEHLVNYFESISHHSPRDYERKVDIVNAISQFSLNELQQLERELEEKELLDKQQTVGKSGNESYVNDLEYLPYDYEDGYMDLHPDEFNFQSKILNLGYQMLEDEDFTDYLMRREQKQNYGHYDPSRSYLLQRRELAPNDDGYLYPVNPYLYFYGNIYNGLSLKGLQKLYYDFLRDRTIAFNELYPSSTTPYHTQLSKKVKNRNKELYQQSIAPINSIATDLLTKKNEDTLQRAKYKVYLSKNKEQQKNYVKAHKEEFEEKAEPHLERRKGNPELRERQRKERLHEMMSEESKESEPPDETVQRYHPRVPIRIYDETVYKAEPKSKPKPKPKPKLKSKGTPI